MAEATERLMLQVDAATELLRRHLADAEPSLDRFERRAGRMAQNVDRAFGAMGQRVSAFGKEAETAAQRAQQSFEASFTQVQKMAATAIKGPTIDGRINLGADDIRAGAAAAQEQARAFGLIEEAARRAAAAERDGSEATRLFIAATTASRIEAEQKAAALLSEAGALERVEIELRQSGAAVDLFVGKHQRIAAAAADAERLAIAERAAKIELQGLAASADLLRAEIDPMFAAQQRFNQAIDTADALLRTKIFTEREHAQAVAIARQNLQAHAQAVAGSVPPTRDLVVSQGALRAAMAGASFQVQDFLTQLSMGANVVQVAVIQGGQLVGQFAHVEAQTGTMTARFVKFSQFMIGPYGLAISAVALLMAPFIGKMLDFTDAIEKATEELEENATKTEVARQAKELWLRTERGAIHDVRALTEELERQNDALKTNAERQNIRIKTRLETLQGDRAEVARQLADARQSVEEARLAERAGAEGALGRAMSKVSQLETRLAGIDTAVAQANAALLRTRADLAGEAASRAVDPIASINRRYDGPDGLIEAAKKRAIAEGKVGTELTRQLALLERQREKEVARARERQSEQRRSTSSGANRQFGREISVADARQIIAGIGGRVTSGTRSTAEQARIYADAQAGRHIGPVAKPGTSAHERGQAVDVAYGPGITVAAIRKAFAGAGVLLRKVLNEPTQRVYHVEFGKAPKAGPSQDTIARRAETARQQIIDRDTAYTEAERAAREKLLSATRRTAASEEEREQLVRESINAEADATRKKVANALEAGDISVAQAARLSELNEATRTQRLQNVQVERAARVLERRYDVEQGDLEARLALLRLGQDMAVTERERRKVARQILEAEQLLRRKALERVRDTSQDPNAVADAKASLGRLPAIEQAENAQLDQRLAGPMEQYRQRLRDATDDMGLAVEEAAARGFGALEDAGSRATASAINDLLGLKGVAGDVIGSIISDLARLAIQKAVVSAIGGGIFGFADGGSLGRAPGYADGGSLGGRISGPGTGRSDSILALLRGPGGKAVRLSRGEFIMNERAVDFYGADAMAAINARQLPRFAGGGSLGSPRAPTLRQPRLPVSMTSGGRRERMEVDVRVRTEPSALFEQQAEATAARTVGAFAEPIMAGSEARVLKRLRRPDLPGSI